MADRKRSVTASDVQDVLNYFGKCPMCGYPARALRITAQFDDGHVESQIIATCEGWCGWKGPATPTPMTGDTIVLAQPHTTIPSPAPALPPDPAL